MLWNYLAGYVIIQIEGMGLERFVNRMLEERLEVWDVTRGADGTLTACVSVGGFYALHRLNRQGARIHIRRKRGLLIYLSRLRARKVLLYGWAAVLCALLIASRFVWVVEITGLDRVKEARVRAALTQVGADAGKPRRGLTSAALREAVMAADPRVAMATASLSGVVLRVEVREAEDPPDILTEDTPAHVCAARDGVILSITALAGRAVVKPGAVVRAGDVLISGLLTREAETPLRVHARGTVMAEVVYTFGGTGQSEEAALRAAQTQLADIAPDAALIEKTSRVTTSDGQVRAVITVTARQNIAQTISLE